ncbi:aliphatic sulfonate ABC transporter substrate-binding protein [Streptomyces sp. JJ38]|nr:aliphatic sulfonate ABC transporter substrate-binding protein [Streptomyces sp. JJ38]
MLATALAALAPLTACSDDGGAADGSGGDTTRVDIGYIADYNGTSLVAIATDQGLWKKQGLDPKLKKFTNGPIQVQALNAGDLDIAYLGPGAAWLPASGQAKIIAINSLGEADRLIAQPGKGITTVADPKGKKVGVPEGTSGDMILQLALEKAGMTPGDVEKVPMDSGTLVSAFVSGQIDAAGIWYPNVSTIEARKPDLVTLATNADFAPEISFPSMYVASNDMADSEKHTVSKVVKVLQEANDLRAQDPAAAIKTTAAFLGLPEAPLKAEAEHVQTLTTAELATATEDGSVDGWLNGLPQTFYLADLYTTAAK